MFLGGLAPIFALVSIEQGLGQVYIFTNWVSIIGLFTHKVNCKQFVQDLALY